MESRLHTYFFKIKAKVEIQQEKEKILKQKLEKYKENVFYTVGNPIHISTPSYFHTSVVINLRKNIPPKEIYESFSGQATDALKLFKTKDEALEYSRYLRKGSQFLEGTEVYQPAIFNVIYLGEIDKITMKEESLLINATQGHGNYDWQERTSSVTYFEAKRKDVIPQEGILMIQHQDRGNFVTHGPVFYDEYGARKENNFFRSIFRFNES